MVAPLVWGEWRRHSTFMSELFLESSVDLVRFAAKYRMMTVVACVALLLFSVRAFGQQKSSLADRSDTPVSKKTFIAPDIQPSPDNNSFSIIPLVYAFGEEIAPPETGIPHFHVFEAKKGNTENLMPGFYAEFKPHENDTLFLYDSSSEHYDRVQIHPGKEIISGDSNTVLKDVTNKIDNYDTNGHLKYPVKHGKTNSMVIRSGFIPAQGFGSKRYRFAVRPGNFKISKLATISASVHMMKNMDMGTVLCGVSKIDYENNTFYVEASNEIPFGENINWIIVNMPE
jgi:hypothetical protein